MKNYQTLLNDYQAFEQRYWQKQFAEEQVQLLKLEKEYKTLNHQLQQLMSHESPSYNIFSILNVRQYEEKLHTPFLCNLLHPKGSHGQQALFLDTFFEKVLHLPYRFENISHFNIREEKRTHKGRIDIILTFYSNHHRVGIVIENKIYGNDQPNQLQRYYNYLCEQLGIEKKYRKLYYLSPHKTPPSPVSLKKEVVKKLKKSKEYAEIGYHADIYPWLNYCLRHIQSPKIQFIIQQYLQTISKL